MLMWADICVEYVEVIRFNNIKWKLVYHMYACALTLSSLQRVC